MSRRVKIPVPPAGAVVEVPGWLDGPAASPWLLVLAPGAGAPADSGFMTEVAVAVSASGDVRVLRFDFPYQVRARAEGKRKPPDRAAVLLATWRAVLAYVGRRLRPTHVAVGGKSMGGRYATLILAEATAGSPLPCEVEACVLLGYPLHPPGRPDRERAGHLPGVGVPTLFVSGTRDSLAGIEAMRRVVAPLAQARLHEIGDADHDFKVPKRSGRTRRDVVAEIGRTTVGFLDA